MINYPKISIVTPVYNQVRFLEETILSVLNQNYPNLEYIIIDGGSTDGTVDIIKRYEDRLAYWISEPDNGMYDALQKGFDRSTGEIMGWINADDLYVDGCFNHLANIFANHKEINWLTGIHTQCGTDSKIIYCWPGRALCKYNYLMKDYMWIAQESTFWHRNLWDKSGKHMAVNLRMAGDFELWLRFFNHAQLYYVKTPLGVYRHREGQLSGQINRYINEVNSIYSKLKICDDDKRIINTYKRKKKIANWINKTRLFNGNKMVRLRSFEKKHLSVPPTLAWSDDIHGYKFDDED